MSDQVFYAQVDVVDAGFQLTVRLIDVTKGSAKRDQKATVSTRPISRRRLSERSSQPSAKRRHLRLKMVA